MTGCRKDAFEGLEPSDGKLSCSVLRGLGAGNRVWLPDQKEIAQAIVDKGANYVLGLKGNQGTLSDRVKTFFDQTEWRNYDSFADWGTRAKEKGHGRVETRRCVALACDHWDGIDAWASLNSVV